MWLVAVVVWVILAMIALNFLVVQVTHFVEEELELSLGDSLWLMDADYFFALLRLEYAIRVLRYEIRTTLLLPATFMRVVRGITKSNLAYAPTAFREHDKEDAHG